MATARDPAAHAPVPATPARRLLPLLDTWLAGNLLAVQAVKTRSSPVYLTRRGHPPATGWTPDRAQALRRRRPARDGRPGRRDLLPLARLAPPARGWTASAR